MKPNLYAYQLAQYARDALYVTTLLAFYAIAAVIDLTPWE